MATELYLRVREREGRLLADDVVATLPRVPAGHPLAAEWRLRADSCRRLVAHLSRRRHGLRVVELGCGNGWLSAHIAAVAGTVVVGADRNDVELEQARRVFARRDTLSFVHHDMRDKRLPMQRPDAIVVASAIQYVEHPGPLIAAWLDALPPHGEVHVLDTPIYAGNVEAVAAAERTRHHYAALGIPEMAEDYHHHTWAAFAELPVEVLYDPRSVAARLQRRALGLPRSPFPWFRIGRDATP